MTKARSLRAFFKKFFNLDSSGMSVSAVLDEITQNNETFPSGGGGGSAAPLFVEFASDDAYSWDETGYYSFQNVTCSETPENIVNAIVEGRTVYATFTDGKNIFSGNVLDIERIAKDEDGFINSVTFMKTIMANSGDNTMSYDQARVDIFEDEENQNAWEIYAEAWEWWAQTYVET